MKKPFTVFGSLSTRIMPSPAVAPWPPVRSAYDRWLAAELDELREEPCTSAAWLGRALNLAVTAQRRLVVACSSDTGRGAGIIINQKTIDECVDDTAELLDACSGLRDRLDMLRSYVTATRVALRWLEEGGQCGGDVAAAAFADCEAVERRCGAELASADPTSASSAKGRCSCCTPSVIRPVAPATWMTRLLRAFRPRRAVSGVSVSGSGGKAMAQWQRTLQEVQRRVREDYDRRRKDGVPCMTELEAAAAAARAVKCSVAGGRGCSETAAIAVAKARCDELEQTVAMFGEQVGDLHRELINLGWCSWIGLKEHGGLINCLGFDRFN
ncbi:hypothetical protein PR202_ga24374 [Eleusine coracana subsp. coracana]|uniref:Uncharacterized protein n=1 Tax=Eleusine coracana subsp. coracana TaxID=191504 RepID=A0AAV5D9C2_ELECO|nr:hypothetical protein QOZ80_9AG0679610 [Eleusine coracana subsp. coracana]GJN06625.1 hypothetical protein PR202_ga24374 [Eleusine coracana subsp. coracana]